MSRRVEIVGQSGQSYAFTRLDGEGFLRQIGVTYLIASQGENGWRVLHVGETNNLAHGSWQPLLAAVREQDPQAECLIRLNVSRSVREVEVADIRVDAQSQSGPA